LPIDFLAIGHITHDRTPEGFRFGGTVSYAAVTAQRLGRRPGILTRGSPERLTSAQTPFPPANVTAPADSDLAGIPIHLLPSPVTTTFVNQYEHGQRTQFIEAVAAPIQPADLPAAWAETPIVLLGPLVREIPTSWVSVFSRSLVGLTPQGWMRQWDATGRVRPAHWENAAEFLRGVDVVILSREDVGGDDAYLAALRRLACPQCLMVVTDGWRGATLYRNGDIFTAPARATHEIDPTGAGDVFATAFLIHLAETRDPLTAVRFANIVASMSVEAPGMAAIPDRSRAEAWLSGNEAV
jgi:sugar/nucleoside kinase (ribokinase family)